MVNAHGTKVQRYQWIQTDKWVSSLLPTPASIISYPVPLIGSKTNNYHDLKKFFKSKKL